MALTKVVNGEVIELTPEEEAEITQFWADQAANIQAKLYAENRRAEYPALGDQLDNIYKALSYLHTNGTDIGADGLAYIEQIKTIKEKYPK